MNLDEEIKKIDATLGDRVPITAEWLKANTFQLTGINRGFDNRSLHLSSVYLGMDYALMPNPQSGLMLEVAPGFDGKWYCWLVQDEPRRSIHIRHVEYRDEIKNIIEGLVGCRWNPKDED